MCRICTSNESCGSGEVENGATGGEFVEIPCRKPRRLNDMLNIMFVQSQASKNEVVYFLCEVYLSYKILQKRLRACENIQTCPADNVACRSAVMLCAAVQLCCVPQCSYVVCRSAVMIS